MDAEIQGDYYWFISCSVSCDFNLNTIKIRNLLLRILQDKNLGLNETDCVC